MTNSSKSKVSKFIVSIASYEKLLDFNREITTVIKYNT